MIINICDTSILCRNQQSHKEFRKQVTLWLSNNCLDKTYVNLETGIEILVNKTGIEKLVSSFGDIKAHSYTAIPAIIMNATFIESEDDNRNRPDFIKTLKFKTLIEVNMVSTRCGCISGRLNKEIFYTR